MKVATLNKTYDKLYLDDLRELQFNIDRMIRECDLYRGDYVTVNRSKKKWLVTNLLVINGSWACELESHDEKGNLEECTEFLKVCHKVL